jgi:hypothetical protein
MAIPKIPQIKMPSFSLAQLPNTVPQASLNPVAFDRQIESQGVLFRHYKAMPTPFVKDVRGDDTDPGDNKDENGSIYYGGKDFIGGFGGDDLQRRLNPTGTWDDEQAIVLVPTTYKDGTSLDVQYWDRIVLLSFPLRYAQRVEHSMSGVDRLHFPALSVDALMDSSGEQYQQGVDFNVIEGEICWVQGGRHPIFDPSYADPVKAYPDPLQQRPSPYGQPALTQYGKGQIYSVVYYCYAQFTVTNLPHQLRIGQTRPPEGGPNVQTRFSQAAIVKKDFVPNDKNDKIGPASSDEPNQGSVRGS